MDDTPLMNRTSRHSVAFMESRIDTVFDHDLALGIGPLFCLRGHPSFFLFGPSQRGRFRAGWGGGGTSQTLRCYQKTLG